MHTVMPACMPTHPLACPLACPPSHTHMTRLQALSAKGCLAWDKQLSKREVQWGMQTDNNSPHSYNPKNATIGGDLSL